MNFLAHLVLAGDDEGLRLGAMLGDFVRGKPQNAGLPEEVCRGIILHRHIDACFDRLPDVLELRRQFPPPFRRYSGIIIDLAFDHELASRWHQYSAVSLTEFDRGIRDMLEYHDELVVHDLRRFMRYADWRGLFASYRSEEEIMMSLRGIGKRLSRPNPLHRVADIWEKLKPAFNRSFSRVFPRVEAAVSGWHHPTTGTPGPEGCAEATAES